MDIDCFVFDCLDKEIMVKEIEVCIYKFKINKSVGNDQLINEYFFEF